MGLEILHARWLIEVVVYMSSPLGIDKGSHGAM